jgi:hypothetical protein
MGRGLLVPRVVEGEAFNKEALTSD